MQYGIQMDLNKISIKNRGFTLLEVMIVLILLVGAFVPIMQTLSAGVIGSQEAKGTNTAILIAQNRLEGLRNLDYSAIASATKATSEGYPAYKDQVVVTESPANLKKIAVTVTWDIGSGNTLALTMETLVSNF
jgi:prepilin-type N-terminal cleavage/methylation domain-containing protein